MSLYTKKVVRFLSEFAGWKNAQRIIVIESDDWGSIRMPSLNSFYRLEKSGIDLRSADAERYNLNDNLASQHDLENLFEVLSSFKDMNGNWAVFTPVCIVANPDFRKISDSGFREYFYEPFTETLKRFPGCENSFTLWKDGIREKIFMPQMHGREHLNVTSWMNALRAGDAKTTAAFNEGMWGFVPEDYPRTDYQAAFLLEDPDELKYHMNVIKEGLELFEKIFGYKAEYFVPPNGIFNNRLNRTLALNGIKFRYASRVQHETLGKGKSSRVFHWLGQKDKNGLRYIIRNCFFEPGQAGKDWIDSCMYDIKLAFRWNKPAIISSHRVNYTGSLNPANRDRGLRQLRTLLEEIIKFWPDVSFITTPELGALISGKSE